MSHPIVERILSGDAPANLKQAAARGAMPIPREDLIELWVLLRTDPDDEIRMACKENLADVSEVFLWLFRIDVVFFHDGS